MAGKQLAMDLQSCNKHFYQHCFYLLHLYWLSLEFLLTYKGIMRCAKEFEQKITKSIVIR
jgi:hypothetical protein